MSMDIDLMDKSHFVCFQLKDESIYFGEVHYKDAEGKLHDPKADPEASLKGNPIRQGFGIQLFGTTQENFLCKYEGYWNLDKQNGECRIWFPDKAFFTGNVKNGVKDGFGKFIWPNGDQYEGNWRNNRFEGGGTFSHNDGSVRKGLFKNNYYVQSGEIFLNPFLSNEQCEEFLQRRHEITQIKEKNKKEKSFFFQKTGNYKNLQALIKKSNQNCRIPLIISSKQLNQNMNELYSQVKKVSSKNFSDLDLRKLYYLKETDRTHNEYLNKIKSKLSDVLVKGEIFIINLDDSDTEFEEIFYPDIREFYKPQCFPMQIWEIDQLKKYQVFEKIIANTDNQFAIDVSDEFNITVWSKLKLDENLDSKTIIEKIERRFQSILPLIKIDFILVTSVNEQEQAEEQLRLDELKKQEELLEEQKKQEEQQAAQKGKQKK